MRIAFLRKRSFPLTFRYSNVQVQEVYFGNSTQVSAYNLSNRTRDLGLTWEWKPHGPPDHDLDRAKVRSILNPTLRKFQTIYRACST